MSSDDGSSVTYRMLLLKNPWAFNPWDLPGVNVRILDWGPLSTLWSKPGGTYMAQQLYGSDAAKFLKYNAAEGKGQGEDGWTSGGEFWIRYEDFLQHFITVFVCRLLDGSVQLRRHGVGEVSRPSRATGQNRCDKRALRRLRISWLRDDAMRCDAMRPTSLSISLSLSLSFSLSLFPSPISLETPQNRHPKFTDVTPPAPPLLSPSHRSQSHGTRHPSRARGRGTAAGATSAALRDTSTLSTDCSLTKRARYSSP